MIEIEKSRVSAKVSEGENEEPQPEQVSRRSERRAKSVVKPDPKKASKTPSADPTTFD